MRWPVVSRDAFDVMERHLAILAEKHDNLMAMYSGLTNVIVEMKREGFTPAHNQLIAPDASTELPEAVMRAIHARSAPGTETFRQLVRGAQQALTPDGSNSEDVADLVYRGAGDEEED